MAQAASCNAMALSFSSSSFGFATADIRRTSCSVGDAAVVKGVLSMQHHSLANAGMAVGAKGSSLIRPASLRGTPLRSGDASKCRWLSQPGTAHVVRASTIGVVKDVKLAAQKMYYNVTLTVLPDSEVAKWYTSPGQYVRLIPANAEPGTRATEFFIASPVRRQCTELEFLIQDVPNTVANDIINSKPGERVVITTDNNSGFDRDSIPYSESVLLFASGYGIGPMRALIETGFEANERKDAILFAMYTPEQEPYKDRHQAWEQTGIKIQSGTPKIPATNAAKTLVYMVASTVEQKKLAAYFEARGVPEDNIYTLFDGIPVASDAYYNKVLHKLNYYPKFPTHSPEHVAVELKI